MSSSGEQTKAGMVVISPAVIFDGCLSRVLRAMQISRSVMTPVTASLPSTTGIKPQSCSHISAPNAARLVSRRQDTAFVVIKSRTVTLSPLWCVFPYPLDKALMNLSKAGASRLCGDFINARNRKPDVSSED